MDLDYAAFQSLSSCEAQQMKNTVVLNVIHAFELGAKFIKISQLRELHIEEMIDVIKSSLLECGLIVDSDTAASIAVRYYAFCVRAEGG